MDTKSTNIKELFSCQFSFHDESSLNIRLFEYNLTLRSAFGTSHSSTSSRQNGLLELSFGSRQGYSEVGLPPKKPFCYEADLNDILTYIKAYVATLMILFESDAAPMKVSDFHSSIDLDKIQLDKIDAFQSDPFAQCGKFFFSVIKQNLSSNPSIQIDSQ